jgi:hypothetical protein
MKDVEELAQMQALAMKTTETMKYSYKRSWVAKINTRGFVTVDSQMANCTSKKRSYMIGFMSREKAERFALSMSEKKGSILTLVYPHDQPLDSEAESFARTSMPQIPLKITRSGEIEKQHSLAIAEPFEKLWRKLLPEMGLAEDIETMERIKSQSLIVFVVDLKWERGKNLFLTVFTELRKCEPPQVKTNRKKVLAGWSSCT